MVDSIPLNHEFITAFDQMIHGKSPFAAGQPHHELTNFLLLKTNPVKLPNVASFHPSKIIIKSS